LALTPEAKVKAQVKKILDAIPNLYYFFPATGGFGRSGVPDIICCVNGEFLAIECKAGKGTTTLLQDREIMKIHAANGRAIVVNENTVINIEKLLKELNGKADYD
jgi:hypothetical protein